MLIPKLCMATHGCENGLVNPLRGSFKYVSDLTAEETFVSTRAFHFHRGHDVYLLQAVDHVISGVDRDAASEDHEI